MKTADGAQSASEGLGDAARDERLFHELADVVRSAREPAESFLTTFLPYALAQAKRHREPLSLLCVSIDRFAAIETLLGRELAEAAMHRVADTIIKMLRARPARAGSSPPWPSPGAPTPWRSPRPSAWQSPAWGPPPPLSPF
jgi:hypothetical protein